MNVSRRLAPWAILCVPVTFVLLAWWPGHMSADWFRMYGEARTGRYTDWGAQLASGLIRLSLPLGGGPAWVLVAQTFAFAIGLYGVFRAILSPTRAALAAAALMLAPQTFGFISALWRDVWFTEAMLLAVAAIVAGAHSPDVRRRRRWLVLSLIALFGAVAARQNAIFAIPPVLLAWIAVWHGDTAPRIPSVRRLAASMVVSIALVIVHSGVSSLLKPADSWPQAYWYLYDVAAVSARTGEDLIPPSLLTGSEADVRAAFNPLAVEAFAGPANRPLRFPRSEREMKELQDAWRRAIVEHPVSWLRVRWTTFSYQTALVAPATWAYHPFIDPNPYGFAPSNPELDEAGRSYVDAFNAPNNNGGPLQTVWLYLVVAGVSAWFLVRSADAGRRILGWLAVAALTYQVGLFLAAMGAQFRLEFPAVMWATIAGAACAVELRWRWRHRPAIADADIAATASK